MVIEKMPWVFVSHASADLLKVRRVRNFMEEQGAAPILAVYVLYSGEWHRPQNLPK